MEKKEKYQFLNAAVYSLPIGEIIARPPVQQYFFQDLLNPEKLVLAVQPLLSKDESQKPDASTLERIAGIINTGISNNRLDNWPFVVIEYDQSTGDYQFLRRYRLASEAVKYACMETMKRAKVVNGPEQANVYQVYALLDQTIVCLGGNAYKECPERIPSVIYEG